MSKRYPAGIVRRYRAYRERKRGFRGYLSFDAWLDKYYPHLKEEAVEPERENPEDDPEAKPAEPEQVEHKPAAARIPRVRGSSKKRSSK